MDFKDSAEKYGQEAAELFRKGDLINGVEIRDYREMRMKESIGPLQPESNKTEWRALFEKSYNEAQKVQAVGYEALGEKHGERAAELVSSGKLTDTGDVIRHREEVLKFLGNALSKDDCTSWRKGFHQSLNRELDKSNGEKKLSLLASLDRANIHGAKAARDMETGVLKSLHEVTAARDMAIRNHKIPNEHVDAYKRIFDTAFRNGITKVYRAATEFKKFRDNMNENKKNMADAIALRGNLSRAHQKEWAAKGAMEAGTIDGEHTGRLYFRGILVNSKEVTAALHEDFAKTKLPETAKNQYAKAYLEGFNRNLENLKRASIEETKKAVVSSKAVSDLKVGDQFTIRDNQPALAR